MAAQPRLIDGIVLTKFDTIDDKVGAAISMSYTAGQPIVFVGTGQSYVGAPRGLCKLHAGFAKLHAGSLHEEGLQIIIFILTCLQTHY